jgi:hypothetical protein
VPEPDLVALFAGPLHRSGALHIPTGLKADFYPSQNDPFFAWAWEKKKTARHAHGEIHYAPPEYVIVWKTAYHAEGGGDKHVRDIRRMIELSSDLVDRRILAGELERRGLLAHFREMADADDFV